MGISDSFLWQKWQKLWQLRHGWRTLWQHGRFLWNNVVFSKPCVTQYSPDNHSVTLRPVSLCALHWAMHATETGANALFWARNTFLRAQRSLNARCEGYHYMTPSYDMGDRGRIVPDVIYWPTLLWDMERQRHRRQIYCAKKVIRMYIHIGT